MSSTMSPTTMTAMVRYSYGSPDRLRLDHVERPGIRDDDVLVRVRAAGLDQGVWHVVTGLPYGVRAAGFGLRRPKAAVPGLDVAGTVEFTGRGVTRFHVGDQVFGTCPGSFAEYAATGQGCLALKPGNLTFAQAAVIPTSGFAALQGLRDTGRIRAGQHVLVIGAGGGVGSFAVQLAKSFGAQVTGVCSTGKVGLVRSIGADEVIDYTRDDFTAGPTRYDLILDTAGGRSLSRLRGVLCRAGTLVIVGSEGRGRWLQGADRQLRAMALSPFVPQRLGAVFSAPRTQDLELLAHLAAAGRVTPVVDRTFPLAEVPAAIRHLRAGRALGKIAIIV